MAEILACAAKSNLPIKAPNPRPRGPSTVGRRPTSLLGSSLRSGYTPLGLSKTPNSREQANTCFRVQRVPPKGYDESDYI